MDDVGRQWRSPNFASRNDSRISMLVMHYTGMKTARDALERLCNPDSGVSAHYLVEECGKVHSLVDEERCAWHAGVSFWRGLRNVNVNSIGIEIVNPGHEWGYLPFPKTQMQAVANLSAEIIKRYKIAAHDVVAHSDIAPARKEDPGELFDWQWLAQQGVGLWPDIRIDSGKEMVCLRQGDSGVDVSKIQLRLLQYGYDVPQHGIFDEITAKVIIAFQRHYRPSVITGEWDDTCNSALAGLLAMS